MNPYRIEFQYRGQAVIIITGDGILPTIPRYSERVYVPSVGYVNVEQISYEYLQGKGVNIHIELV